MATRKSSSKSSSKGKASRARSDDAIALLTQDHRNVDKLFEQFEALGEDDDEAKTELVETICNELIAHTTVEEEIFYPAAREALGDEGDDLLDEAEVEHASAKDLIAQLQEGSPSEELYDAKVKVLAEYIRHHVKEEENELFPQVKESELDLDDLGAQIRARKEEILEAPVDA